MKKTIFGIIIGLVIGTFGMVFAQEIATYVVETANFPILVNGKEFKTDKPIVTIDGSTYLPLRAIGEALGVKINWNEEKFQAEIGEMPDASKYSRLNPAPIGIIQVVTFENILDKCTAEVTVKEVIRGNNAWSMISQANMFNKEPKEGYEYILAKINFKLINIDDEKSMDLNSAQFDLYSSDYEKYDSTMIVPPDPILQSTLYKNASSEGWVAYLVKTDDSKPTIAFGQAYDGTGGVWFKAYK